MVLRRRKLGKVVEKLDAFPKVPDDYVEQSSSNGLVTIITAFLVGCVIYTEVDHYFTPSPTFNFSPDTDFAAKLKINVDITVATPCDLIGPDVVDSTGENAFSFGKLNEEPTWFELDRLQRQHFDSVKQMNEYLREEYHAVQNIVWGLGPSHLVVDYPERRKEPGDMPDACRFYGSLTLNKLAGIFHIMSGKVVPLAGFGHAHISSLMGHSPLNFSHRINRLSFGDQHGAIIQPLEGDEKFAEYGNTKFQYYLQVVPTEIEAFYGSFKTFQYSVTELEKSSKDGPSVGPGIFFTYDTSALKVFVSHERQSLAQFFVRLCASVGGIVATSGVVCDLLSFVPALLCRLRIL